MTLFSLGRLVQSLDQFYRMKTERDDPEMNYVMGNRILNFLTECLPTHPDYQKPLAFKIRNKIRQAAESLESCLEDIAISIDERVCNHVVDFGPEFDSMLMKNGDDDDTVSTCSTQYNGPPIKQTWPPLEAKFGDSPTTTLTTIGTESERHSYLSSSFDDSDLDDEDKEINFPDFVENEEEEMPFFIQEESNSDWEDYLFRVANEDFPFECDSDADDSWAQNEQLDFSTSEFLQFDIGSACDPTQMTFGDLLLQMPEKDGERHAAYLNFEEGGDSNPMFSVKKNFHFQNIKSKRMYRQMG